MSGPAVGGDPFRGGGGVDIERLIVDLERRVAARRAEGPYDDEIARIPFAPVGPGGDDRGPIRLRPETAYSSKPVLGRAVTLGKQVAIRGMFHFINDVVAQANAALARMDAALQSEQAAREALDARLSVLEARAAPSDPRGAPAEAARLAAITDRVAALERVGAPARLARLEREERPAASAEELRPLSPELASLAAVAALREHIDPGDPGRLDAYLAHLAAGGVLEDGVLLDLSPTDHALGAHAAEAGVATEALEEPPLLALAARPPASLGGVAGLGLVDRLDAGGSRALLDLLRTRLAPGAGVVLELLNPLSLAGRAARLRDPTLVRPVHPEALAALARAAGLVDVELRHLGSFTGDGPLALEAAPVSEDDDRYNAVVGFVNAGLVGTPLVALLARAPSV